jgi:hypothetical protein
MANATVPASVKDTAAAIRADLKAAFPGVKFSVRKGAGTAASWIDISWTDGPNDDMVRNICDPYTAGFDSPVEGVCRERTISFPVRVAAQDRIREVLPDFQVYDADEHWAPSDGNRVEVFHLEGWGFGGGSAYSALIEVADLLILNPRPIGARP